MTTMPYQCDPFASATISTSAPPPSDDLAALLDRAADSCDRGDMPGYLALLRRSLAIDPTWPSIKREMSIVLGTIGTTTADLREALRLGAEAVAADPLDGDARMATASAAYLLGLEAQQWEHLRAALELVTEHSPNFALARKGLAALRLEMGDYSAWPDYVRYTDDGWRDRITLTTPVWQGEDPAGKTILLHCVHDGFGDALQFVRYAQMVKGRGATVVLVCRPSLARLLATCAGVDRVIVDGARVDPELVRHDCHSPLVRLPAVFGTMPETVPNRVPYLSASADALGELASQAGEHAP